MQKKKSKGKKLVGKVQPTPIIAIPTPPAEKKAKKKTLDQEGKYIIDEDEEEPMFPGQMFRPTPESDGTRIFYDTLLKQRPWSLMAIKYCTEHGLMKKQPLVRIIIIKQLVGLYDLIGRRVESGFNEINIQGYFIQEYN